MPKSGEMLQVPFDGESMRPMLFPGDVLLCSPDAPLRLGGIYILHDEGGLVAHRLVRMGPTPLFKGDRSRPLHPARGKIWGEVCSVERNGKRIDLPTNPLVLAVFAWVSRLRGR